MALAAPPAPAVLTSDGRRIEDGRVYRFTDRVLAETYEYFADVDEAELGLAGALFSVQDRDPDGWPDYLVLLDGRITATTQAREEIGSVRDLALA